MLLAETGVSISFHKIFNFILPVLVFFFDPMQAKLLLALLALMAIDTASGAYYFYNKGEYEKKKFFSRGIAKFFKYFSAVAAAHLLEGFLVGIPYSQELDSYVLAFLAITEFKSFYTYLVKFGLKLPMPPKLQSIVEEIGIDNNKK